jgi:hypothetical protein
MIAIIIALCFSLMTITVHQYLQQKKEMEKKEMEKKEMEKKEIEKNKDQFNNILKSNLINIQNISKTIQKKYEYNYPCLEYAFTKISYPDGKFCRYGDKCSFIHTESIFMLKSMNCKYENQHDCPKRKNCIFMHKKIQNSENDHICGVCYTNIIKQCKDYGLLYNCDHIFCHQCIKSLSIDLDQAPATQQEICANFFARKINSIMI